MIKALVSRSRIFELHPLTEDDIRQILENALADPENGYGVRKVALSPEAMAHLTRMAGGDARNALNALELAVETTPPGEDEVIHINLDVAQESIQKRAVLYDKGDDAHYDTISAFIKSVRGSDPDAALYWLAKMLYAGEDPRFVLRRLIILAGEDIGMADPQGLVIATSAAQAFEMIGMPEGIFPIVEATLYLATAPKSNSAFAYHAALAEIEENGAGPVPIHLMDGSRDAKGLGHGQGYDYPHNHPDHWTPQQYLPETKVGKVFYEPSNQGYETQVAARLERWRNAQAQAMADLEQEASKK